MELFLKTRPLVKRILILMGSVIGLSSLAILVAAWVSTTHYAQLEVADRLTVGRGVLQQTLENNRRQLLSTASVLVADLGFKGVVSSGDRATATSILGDHGNKVGADFMVLIDSDERVIASSQDILAQGSVFAYGGLIAQAFAQGQATFFFVHEDRFYQMMLVSVNAPLPIAVLGVGFEIDQSFVKQLKMMTKLEVSVVAQGVGRNEADFDKKQRLITSTLLPDLQALAFSHLVSDHPSFSQLIWRPFASRSISLLDSDELELDVILSADLHEIFLTFRLLQYEIILIAALTFLSVFLVIAWWSRAITLPLSHLAQWSSELAAGDYRNRKLTTTSDLTEICDLIRAFGNMQCEIADREQKIRFHAQHDLLTQLLNRLSITTLIEERLAQGQQFQVVGISVMDFQGLNNVFGFQNGDKVLASLADRILRLGGKAARLNGGELLWIPEEEHSLAALEKVRESLDRAHMIGGLNITAKTVMGELWAPRDGCSAEVLLRRTSIVLDHAEQGDQRCRVYEASMEEDYLKRLEMIGQLKRALTTHQSEFSICYQPKVLAKSRRVLKAEALARWTNEKLGWVPPDQFVAIAEKAGLINVLTDCVISRVILDLQRWRAAGVDIQVAINLSVTDIVNPKLLPNVMTYLSDANLPVESVSFEITESELMAEPEAALLQLRAFREAGFSLAIDDFGTGYSSLTYLKRLPVTELKIDKSFVMKLDSDDDDQKIVQSIIALGKQFGLSLVAEGVENVEAMEMLEAWQCDWLQGFYLCRPLPEREFFEWLRKYQALAWANVS